MVDDAALAGVPVDDLHAAAVGGAVGAARADLQVAGGVAGAERELPRRLGERFLDEPAGQADEVRALVHLRAGLLQDRERLWATRSACRWSRAAAGWRRAAARCAASSWKRTAKSDADRRDGLALRPSAHASLPAAAVAGGCGCAGLVARASSAPAASGSMASRSFSPTRPFLMLRLPDGPEDDGHQQEEPDDAQRHGLEVGAGDAPPVVDVVGLPQGVVEQARPQQRDDGDDDDRLGADDAQPQEDRCRRARGTAGGGPGTSCAA